MHQYLRNLITRLRNHSKNLDRIEVFAEKPWIYIDSQNNHHEYLFMYDNRLIMSLNGIVTQGSWELLPNGKLLINRVVDQIMLQNQFIDDALMLLQKSGTNEMPFTLINQSKIPDLDAIKYLENLEERTNYSIGSIPNGYFQINRSNKIINDNIDVGYKLYKHDSELISGVFQLENSSCKYVEVQNNIVVNIYQLKDFKLKNGDVISIKTDSIGELNMDSRIENFDSLGLKSYEKISVFNEYNIRYIITVNDSGLVIKIIDPEWYFIVYSILIILGIAILLTLSQIL